MRGKTCHWLRVQDRSRARGNMCLVTGAGKRVKLSKACYIVYYQHDIFHFGGLVHAPHRLLSYVQAPMGNLYSINSLSSEIPISYFYSFLITGVGFLLCTQVF